MKMLYSPYNLNLDMPSENVTTLVLEHQKVYRELVADLYRQCSGLDGTAVFSEGSKELKFSSDVEIVMNPMEIHFNSSRLKGKLIKEVVSIGKEYYFREWLEGTKPLVEYVDKILQDVPYNVVYDDGLDLEDVLKTMGVRLDYEESELADQLCGYIQILSLLMGVKLLILVSPSLYFTKEERTEIYKKTKLSKVTLLNIETSDIDADGLKYVLDQDLCLIHTCSETLQHVPTCRFGENLGEFEV